MKRFLQMKVFFFVLFFSMNAAAKVWVVQVADFSFTPDSLLTVRVGDTIRWVWVNGTHTTTSISVPALAPIWDAPVNSTIQTFEYKVMEAGTYTYKCKFHAAMGMVGMFQAEVASAAPSLAINAQITIYPSPFTGNVTFHYLATGAPLRTLKIFDITGNELAEYNWYSESSESEKTLDLSNIQQGVVLFEFIDASGKAVVRRVVRKG
ncbi:MAG TPA: T9SS type A sorting domain-containing protein [Bacteroidales bacterium]|nr:T9SS type A sorting domain-containing protein [Bacteroidales bacterium]